MAGLLCRQHTSLTETDIEKIEQVAAQLELIADLSEANVFIDCQVKGTNNAIVVAEAAPTSGKTLYHDPYVGTIVYEVFEPSVFFSYRTGKNILFNRAVTQRGKLVKQSVAPIKNDEGQVIGMLIKEEDMPEMKASEKMRPLSSAPEMLWELFFGLSQDRPSVSDIMREYFILIDASHQVVYVNSSARSFVSEVYHILEPEGKMVTDVLPFIAPIMELNQDLVIQEMKIPSHFLEVKKVNIYQDDEITGMLILLRDITDLRMKERELVVKSVAIREIHHRVKNNLQTVASLLRLQIRNGVAEESRGHLTDSLNRVLSIASVYEIILANEQGDDDEVDIVSLSKKVGNMLLQHSEHSDVSIQMNYIGDTILLDSKKAVSIALVVNELIQNSIKHAFINRPSGEITVGFEKRQDDILLSVTDNGVGIKKEMNHSLGLDIVKMLIEHDLAGEYDIQSSQLGTKNIITFPIDQGVV
ncbi:two-component sensor histidine kinase [Bacillus ectoiniformans]|nr:two-component sensor histidine kinase [Bacillus ectoiniformans]